MNSTTPDRDDTIVDLPTLLRLLHFGAPLATPAIVAKPKSDPWQRWIESKAYSAALWPDQRPGD